MRTLCGAGEIFQQVRALEVQSRAQADFAHAARVVMLGELTASIAHEVGQPLSAIAVAAEAGLRWLDRPEPDLGEVRQLTKSILADTRRACALVASIRAMATKRPPEQTVIALDDAICEALAFLRHDLQAHGVTLSKHLVPGAPRVLGNRIQLQQVIVNLVVNSMQAMAQAEGTTRKVAIRTAMCDPASVCCTVVDTGPGIRPENLAQLFESFFTTKPGGMGMGLAICRFIIEAHGGRISADNDRVDGGARLFFTLPIAIQN